MSKEEKEKMYELMMQDRQEYLREGAKGLALGLTAYVGSFASPETADHFLVLFRRELKRAMSLRPDHVGRLPSDWLAVLRDSVLDRVVD